MSVASRAAAVELGYAIDEARITYEPRWQAVAKAWEALLAFPEMHEVMSRHEPGDPDEGPREFVEYGWPRTQQQQLEQVDPAIRKAMLDGDWTTRGKR